MACSGTPYSAEVTLNAIYKVAILPVAAKVTTVDPASFIATRAGRKSLEIYVPRDSVIHGANGTADVTTGPRRDWRWIHWCSRRRLTRQVGGKTQAGRAKVNTVPRSKSFVLAIIATPNFS